MTWSCYLFDNERDAWILWTTGSLEDVLDTAFDWRSGEYGERYDKVRIEAEKVR